MRPCARAAWPGYRSTSAGRPPPTRSQCPFSSGSEWTSSAWRPLASARSARGSAALTTRRAERFRRGAYSVSPLTQLDRAASASLASSPSALRRRTVPPTAPRASTARMLLASATFPSEPMVSRERNRSAVFTKVAAGRAWSATPAGRATVDSELAGTARFLGGFGHVLERLAGRRHDGRGHRALDEGSVHQSDVAVGLALEQVADGEDRAAEVGEHDHALAAVGPRDRLPHGVAIRPELSVRTTARGLDFHLSPGDLGGQIRKAARELKAVGHQYNPDQIRHSPARLNWTSQLRSRRRP